MYSSSTNLAVHSLLVGILIISLSNGLHARQLYRLASQNEGLFLLGNLHLPSVGSGNTRFFDTNMTKTGLLVFFFI